MVSTKNLNIIFLDFDGVLDTAFYDSYLEQHNIPSCDESGRPIFDPVCTRYLKQIVEITHAQIVVSSDWKYYDSLEDLRKMWEERQMPGSLLDVTPNIKISRGAEISEWLNGMTNISNYVIIDDLGIENFNEDQLDHLVTVNPYCGIDEYICLHAIDILNKNYDCC